MRQGGSGGLPGATTSGGLPGATTSGGLPGATTSGGQPSTSRFPIKSFFLRFISITR